MLVQRRRRWSNIKTTLVDCSTFAGLATCFHAMWGRVFRATWVIGFALSIGFTLSIFLSSIKVIIFSRCVVSVALRQHCDRQQLKKESAPTRHTTLLRRWINVNDVDSHHSHVPGGRQHTPQLYIPHHVYDLQKRKPTSVFFTLCLL